MTWIRPLLIVLGIGLIITIIVSIVRWWRSRGGRRPRDEDGQQQQQPRGQDEGEEEEGGQGEGNEEEGGQGEGNEEEGGQGEGEEEEGEDEGEEEEGEDEGEEEEGEDEGEEEEGEDDEIFQFTPSQENPGNEDDVKKVNDIVAFVDKQPVQVPAVETVLVRILQRASLYFEAVQILDDAITNLAQAKSTLEQRETPATTANVKQWQNIVNKQRENVVKFGNELSTYMMNDDVRPLLLTLLAPAAP
jgi:hypothetical protein